ncbi:MAG: 50S ribosomal protein L6 [Candidatus Magasanikbacteria bacterium GW2011_GWD2_43_18]|uniref:Large ribosomal subunit protein uL6 n=1 Tax=Candidatus Magasanikbacteria bacterium GW2011_GWE2_42_7 TaxID=1619052 RepID=A0A0G1DJV2_9BACT|nr:MAG: 50S ribosomal protein L6 [Candidatus Magasanikbacteria bacterium GW2011_GWC2_42_27]KKS71116.1 MAG: 50S ribosomal protein L6 [Candidatus Magasanikbacteria bacterium GW2011_GWE2_42_7]KKT04288.1 MAG: 50S ribosomal protein L6 [Candidatus Magasanikbacteria bacterium GW2011_GWD2_43_18]KKT24863.1 MAG: 50S ribosomal protein L6 [Candidatus Magasanikbacteria bacterium GW2011_GWA2_43_9]HBB38368.1 50S ribosomal protein L6 [Candidatus Magasanikbacteria bacterium]
MSRIGKKTIEIPQGVTVTIANDVVKVQGPKGTLERRIHPLVSVSVTDNVVAVDVVQKEEKKERSLWGTFGAHIRNMIEGVTTGFKKELEVNGVGYKVAMQGTDLKLDLGFSHPVIYKIPATVQASVEKNVMTLVSADKELLGATAAEIRSIRKPEPYKGKGIKYMEEQIRRKAGKAAKAAGA